MTLISPDRAGPSLRSLSFELFVFLLQICKQRPVLLDRPLGHVLRAVAASSVHCAGSCGSKGAVQVVVAPLVYRQAMQALLWSVQNPCIFLASRCSLQAGGVLEVRMSQPPCSWHAIIQPAWSPVVSVSKQLSCMVSMKARASHERLGP